MSDVGRVELDFLVEVAEDPDWAREETKRMRAYNRDHGALYGDDPVPTSLKPNFISPAQERLIEHASHRLWQALETFVEVFLDSPQLQADWGVSDEELELYQVDPGYPGAIQVSRFDGFLDDDELTFLEFNCDSPGGAGYGDVIHEAFLEVVKRRPSLGRGHELSQTSRIEALRDALVSCYRSWREDKPDRPEAPYVVLADWPDVGSRPDIDITVERLRRLGVDVAFADPRKLDLDGEALVHEGRRVDVLYKRVITSELVAEDDAEAVLTAYRAGTVCMVNAPRSVIVGNKKIMAALRREDVQAAMRPPERRAVERFVPWTAVLEEGPVEIDGLTVDLRELVLENQDALVLKAARSYGGRDVHLGLEADAQTWGQLVDAHMGGDWVVQRRAKIPKGLYPHVDGDRVDLVPRNVNVNPFVFGGRYAGAYTRVSSESVINISHGGGLVPTVTVEPDEAT